MKDLIKKYLSATKKKQILIGILIILVGSCIAFIPVIGVPVYLIVFWIGVASIACGIMQRKTDDNTSVQERYPAMNGITKKWWFWLVVVIVAMTVIGSFGSIGDSIMPTDSATPTAALITPVPTLVPTNAATPQKTAAPELSPTSAPNPTVSRTPEPTPAPTSAPTPSPTKTATPTDAPKPSPTKAPLTVGDLSRDQWEGKYVGSTESNKYHTPSCTHAKKILIINAIWWDSVEEAKQAGYVPCGTCQD